MGDKTGGGGHGSNNDIGVLWLPERAPVMVTSYLAQSSADLEKGLWRMAQDSQEKAFRAGMPLRAELLGMVYEADEALGHEAESESLGFTLHVYILTSTSMNCSVA